MVARLRAVPRPVQVAEELLGRFGLLQAADRRVSTYSGGMTRVRTSVLSPVDVAAR